jgi:hypothetical protein
MTPTSSTTSTTSATSATPFDFEVFKRLSTIILEEDVSQNNHDLPMTRSPLHTIAFFIIFAIINQTDRESVINNLNSKVSLINKGYKFFNVVEFESFIVDFDWGSIEPDFLKIKSNKIKLSQIENNLRKNFDGHCISLMKYFKEDEINEIIVETTVESNPIWKSPFEREGDLWKIPNDIYSLSGFKSSESFKNDQLEFEYSKYVDGIDVYITGNGNSNNESIRELNMEGEAINHGVYDSFLRSCIGTIEITELKVKLSGNFNITNQGASCKQTQEVIIYECFSLPKSKLILKNFFIYFSKIGVNVSVGDVSSCPNSYEKFKLEIFTKNNDDVIIHLNSNHLNTVLEGLNK